MITESYTLFLRDLFTHTQKNSQLMLMISIQQQNCARAHGGSGPSPSSYNFKGGARAEKRCDGVANFSGIMIHRRHYSAYSLTGQGGGAALFLDRYAQSWW